MNETIDNNDTKNKIITSDIFTIFTFLQIPIVAVLVRHIQLVIMQIIHQNEIIVIMENSASWSIRLLNWNLWG